MAHKRKPTESDRHEQENIFIASERWGDLSEREIVSLRELTSAYGFSVARGDLIILFGSWFITHTGLIGLAERHSCAGIHVQAIDKFCDPAAGRWAFKAVVYKTRTCKGFVGYGDADPSNVSPQVRGAEMRVAETRAVNRALRKAYGIGICSVEELGSNSGPFSAAKQIHESNPAELTNGNNHHPLRDRLCLLIRQHHLDPVLVKAYAADHCDVPELRQASRDQVASFITHLAEYAQSDRAGLLAQLSGYAPKPVSPATVPSDDNSTSVQEETRSA